MTVTDIPIDNDGIVAVGGYELTMSSRVGALVSPLTRFKRAGIMRRDMPALTLPVTQRLFGRRKELAQLMSLAAVPGAIEVVGREGNGKSALLRRLLAVVDTANFESMLFLHASGMTYGDLLSALFHAQYDSEGYTPTYSQMQRYLSLRRALVILDEYDGSAEAAMMLVDTMPGCVVIIASPAPCLPGHPIIEVGGLPKDDALELVEWASGETITQQSLAQFENLVAGVDGRPLDLLRAVSADRAPRSGVDEVLSHSQAALAETGKRSLAPMAFTATSPVERSVLGAFVAVNGAALDLDAVAAIAQMPDAGRVVAELAWRGLLDSDGRRVWVRPNDLGLAFAVSHEFNHFDQAYTYFQHICSQPSIGREKLETLSDAICRVISIALARERYRDVALVGRPFADAAFTAGLLGKAEIALRCVSEAADRTRDQALSSWALHQLGVLALCLDDSILAGKSLRRALKLREKAKDAVAESVTKRALAQVVTDDTVPEKRTLPFPVPEAVDEFFDRIESRFRDFALPPALEPYRHYFPLAGIALAAMLGGLFVIQVIRLLFPAAGPGGAIAGQDLAAQVRISPGAFGGIRVSDGESASHAQHQRPQRPAAPAPRLTAPPHPWAAVDNAAAARSVERTAAPRVALRPASPQPRSIARPAATPKTLIHVASAKGEPQIVSFDAEPSTITAGEYARLCAYVRNADSARIETVGGIAVGNRTCVNVSPKANTVFTLSVFGGGREYKAYATVGVQLLPSRLNEEPTPLPT